MKTYTIWIKGGRSICGDVSDILALRLVKEIRMNDTENLEFDDEEGPVLLKLQEIQGIAITPYSPGQGIGFSKEEVLNG